MSSETPVLFPQGQPPVVLMTQIYATAVPLVFFFGVLILAIVLACTLNRCRCCKFFCCPPGDSGEEDAEVGLFLYFVT